jgi:hypothetical protein
MAVERIRIFYLKLAFSLIKVKQREKKEGRKIFPGRKV